MKEIKEIAAREIKPGMLFRRNKRYKWRKAQGVATLKGKTEWIDGRESTAVKTIIYFFDSNQDLKKRVFNPYVKIDSMKKN